MPNVPDDIKYLLPTPQNIVIGTDVKELYPLPLEKWQRVFNTLEGVVNKMFDKKLNEAISNPQESVNVMITKIIEAIKDNIGPILAIALNMEEETIKSSITIPQISFAAKKIWEMNLKQPMIDISSILDSVLPKKVMGPSLTPDEINEVISEATGKPHKDE